MPDSQPPCSVRAEVQALVDREIKHLKELTERTTALKDEALLLQRTEYLRRLDELNNAHARAETAQRATVPRETFDVFVTNYNRWREECLLESQTIKASQAARDRIFYLAVAVIGVIFPVITIYMALRSK